jgi:pSer/pThr/pTyr-binding forkhead associated (FHA) protein
LTLHPPERAARFIIVRDGETLVVGRAADCGLVLEDPKVSKHHAELRWDGAGWRLFDLGSKNGTSVNGRLARGATLRDGDWVSFGGLAGVFQRISEEEASRTDAERLARLATSLDLRRRLSAERDPLDLLLRLLESALEVAGADRGFVLMRGPDGALRAEVVAGFEASHLAEQGFSWSVGAVERALRTGVSFVLSDVRADAELGGRPSVVTRGIGTLACVPLRKDEQVIGLIYVDSRRRGRSFSPLDVEILETLADHVAVLVEGLRLCHRIERLLGTTAGAARSAGRAVLDELQRKIEAAVRDGVSPETAGVRAAR